MAVNGLLGYGLSKFRNTRLGRILTWATTPVTVTCLPILAAACAAPMVGATVFVSAARLGMAGTVRPSAAARSESNFIGTAGCGRPGRDSRVKWKQAAPRQDQRQSGGAQAPSPRWFGTWERLKRAYSSQASVVGRKARLERPSSVLLRCCYGGGKGGLRCGSRNSL